jgi:DNA-binding transcriptional LysR family regulator
METGLVNGTLDVAITTYLPATSDRLVAEPLFNEALVLAVGPRHALHGRAEVDLEALASVPLVLRPASTPSRQLIERCFAARGCAPNVGMEVNSGEAALATVRCSALATICGGRSLENVPGISTVRIDDPALRRSGAILWHRGRYRSTAAVVLAEMAQRAYARDASAIAA